MSWKKNPNNQNVPTGKMKKLLKLLQYLCMPTTYHADGQHEDSLMMPLKPFDYCFSAILLKFLSSFVLAPLNIPAEVLTYTSSFADAVYNQRGHSV